MLRTWVSVSRSMRKPLETTTSFSSRDVKSQLPAPSFSEAPTNTCLIKSKGTFLLNLDLYMIQFVLPKELWSQEKSLQEEELLMLPSASTLINTVATSVARNKSPSPNSVKP